MSHDEGAPVDPGLEPGYDEDLLVEEAASSQPASTVPATADSSHAGLRVGDSSAAGPALSAPESAPASASAEQLARLSNDVGWTVTGLTNVHGADALRPALLPHGADTLSSGLWVFGSKRRMPTPASVLHHAARAKNHDYLKGCRVGEAAHPGPPRPNGAASTPRAPWT